MSVTSTSLTVRFPLYLIIAHELQRQECSLLMAQQQILAVIPNSCRAELTLALLWLLS